MTKILSIRFLVLAKICFCNSLHNLRLINKRTTNHPLHRTLATRSASPVALSLPPQSACVASVLQLCVSLSEAGAAPSTGRNPADNDNGADFRPHVLPTPAAERRGSVGGGHGPAVI